jgi:WD40 repeat protein/serine/threonine protein kinase
MANARDLLIGELALRLGMIESGVFQEMVRVLESGSDCTISELLVRNGHLTVEDEKLLYDVVARARGLRSESELTTLDGDFGNADPLDSYASARSLDSAVELPAQDDDRYLFLTEFARGGIGRIMEVWDPRIKRHVALKVLHPTLKETAEEDGPAAAVERHKKRFLREAQITGRLEHPSIIPLYEIGRRPDGSLYYTMKLVRGNTLDVALRKAGSLEARLALLPHFLNLCQAIAYAHSRGVIHRDIKPKNILIGAFGETLVIDWGLAKSKSDTEDSARNAVESETDRADAPRDSRLSTQDGQVMGTPHFMPPEQAAGDIDGIDEQSDVYGLGAVLYQLLTGKPPYADLEKEDVYKEIAISLPEPIESTEPNVPKDFAAVCRRAMHPDKSARYATVKELIDEVQRYHSGALVGAYDYRFSELFARFVKKHKTRVVAVSTALIVLFSFGIYTYIKALSAEHTEHALRLESDRNLYSASIAAADHHIDRANVEVARSFLEKCPPEYRNWEWGRLKYVCDATHVDLEGHDDGVWATAISTDSRLALTGEDDGTAILWDLDHARMRYRIQTNHEGISSAAFRRHNKEFITAGGNDDTIKVWDVATGNHLRTLTGHAAPLSEARPTPDGKYLISAAFDGTAVLWDLETDTVVRTYPQNPAEINALAIDDSGTRFAIGCDDGMVHILNIKTGDTLLSVIAHPETFELGIKGVLDVAFRPGFEMFATSGNDHIARMWSLKDGALLSEYPGHHHKVWSVSFTPDGAVMATAGNDRTVGVWDILNNGRDFVTPLSLPRSAVNALFTPDGTHLISTGDDPIVKVWDMTQPGGRRILADHQADVNTVVFSPDDRLLVTTSGHWNIGGDSRVLVWDVASSSVRHELEGHEGPVFAAVFHPNGRWVTTAGQDRRIITWDVITGARLSTFIAKKHNFAIRCLAYSPDGKKLLSGGWNDSIGVPGYDINEQLSAEPQADDSLSDAVLWNMESESEIRSIGRHQGGIDTVAFSPDGSLAVTGARDGVARLWQVRSGQLSAELNVGGTWVSSVAFDPAGKRLAIGSNPHGLQLWDVDTGHLLREMVGHKTNVKKVAFSPDGKRLVSGDESQVNLWDTERGELLLSIPHGSNSVAFSHDGLTLATAGVDGDVSLWYASPWNEPAPIAALLP